MKNAIINGLEEWENTNPEYLPQSELLVARYAHFLYNNPHPIETTQPKNRSGFQQRAWWIRGLMAASVLVVLGIAAWLFSDYAYYKTYQAAYGEVKTFVLADGSQVTLNANSSLRLPRLGIWGRKTGGCVRRRSWFYSNAPAQSPEICGKNRQEL